ncbi:MAG: hypothetical protein QOJ25_1347 [Solirubrobacteraceae bacterium]|nr:hypothetical protein [Solirubrobacteraceae bacterium]
MVEAVGVAVVPGLVVAVVLVVPGSVVPVVLVVVPVVVVPGSVVAGLVVEPEVAVLVGGGAGAGVVVHEPVVGVTTGVEEVNLGVVMVSSLGDEAELLAEAPLEGSVVEIVVVSVRPGVEGTSGVVVVVAPVVVAVVLAAFLAAAFLRACAFSASRCASRAEMLDWLGPAGTTVAASGVP